MVVSDARRLKELEADNKKLKNLLAVERRIRIWSIVGDCSLVLVGQPVVVSISGGAWRFL